MYFPHAVLVNFNIVFLNFLGSDRIKVKNLTSTKVSSTLTISSVTMKDDKSQYKCKAQNINGSSNSVKIVVIVDGKKFYYLY